MKKGYHGDAQQKALKGGKLKKYYQPRKSHRSKSLILEGVKVPLYGAGAVLPLTDSGGSVPLTLEFDLITQGYVVGKLVRVKHNRQVSCQLVVDSSKSKAIKLSRSACTYG
ncbi:hypothetical protein HPP92_021301 [Vanilla planifolia]|uniref:Uncharacterized protein n=1 Tax=Vanilla planifolia TaxID=51239 RepID=A0A835Q230_VANPL|nr:hypothetical protein HPP92_021301 [Vanilla planifolia]